MKLDLMVYGRGVERLDGYQMFASPPYWTEEMLMYLTNFSQLWSEFHDSESENFSAWAKTYLFVCLPPPYCCALLRCVRVEGNEPDTWLLDEKNREIWSLEGWCCPPEQRDYFFPLLPSLILWMEQNHNSLYQQFHHQKINSTLELPEHLIFNPYSELSPPNIIDSIMKAKNEQENWLTLCRKIQFSVNPFPFLYGALAGDFVKYIGREYQIQEVFSPSNSEHENNQPYDPFQEIEFIQKRNLEKKQHTYHLGIHVNAENKPLKRRWGIYESKTDADILESPWINVNDEQGISMLHLLAEADCIRDFVKKMQWETSLDTAETHLRYTFKKEE